MRHDALRDTMACLMREAECNDVHSAYRTCIAPGRSKWVYLTTGGTGPSCTKVLKRIAGKIAEKNNIHTPWSASEWAATDSAPPSLDLTVPAPRTNCAVIGSIWPSNYGEHENEKTMSLSRSIWVVTEWPSTTSGEKCGRTYWTYSEHSFSHSAELGVQHFIFPWYPQP